MSAPSASMSEFPDNVTKSENADTPSTPIATPVWYGLCGHWTADWGKLKGPGIPSCPLDNAVGFHAEPTWWADVDAYEAAGHPGYRKQVEALEIP